MIVDFDELNTKERYHLMTQTIIPRPIAWVLSENEEGKSYNLAPFSYFNAVCSVPPLLMISVGKQLTGEQKDTSTNLQNGNHCVVHIPSSSHAQEVTQSAASFPYGESEVSKLDLELIEEKGFSIPRLSDCKIAFMCNVYDRTTIGEAEQNLIFLEIKHTYIDETVLSHDEKDRLVVNAENIDPLARLGANQYSSITGVLDLKRPK